MYMVQKLELFPTSYEYSIGKYNNLKELFVRGDVDISGNIAMSGNINCNEINSTSITATTFYGDGSQLTGIITSGGSANLNEHSDASFGNVDVSGNININGKATITINDVANQNTTLLELKTDTNTPRIRHDFWQTSNNYGDYQIYPASAGTTDFKIGGYTSTFQTIRLNALNGVEVFSNQSTNTFGKLKCDILELTNKIQGPSDLIIDPSPYDSSGGNVTVMGNLKVDGLLDINNNVDISGNLTVANNVTATTFIGDGSQLTGISAGANLTNYSDASFGNVDIRNTLTLINNNDIYYQQIGSDIDGEAKDDWSSYSSSVSLSSDGSIVAIGAPYNDGGGNNAGHVRVYQNINSVWTQLGGDIDGDTNYEEFGFSLSLSSDGTRVAIGAIKYDQVTIPSTDPNYRKGRVKIYEYDIGTNSWIQLGSDIEGEGRNDGSGGSISLSSDGTIVAIGAGGNDDNGADSGHVRIYQYASNYWTQLGSDIDGEGATQRAHAVSLSSDGTIVAIGAHRNSENGGWAGNVRVFNYLNNSWTQIGSDIYGESANDQAGEVGSVSLSSDGTILAVGSIYNSDNGSNSGHVRVFQYNSNTNSWSQIGTDIDGESANDYSGKVSLSSDGTTLAIGANYALDENGNNTGRVKVYRYTNNSWTQLGSNIYGDAQGDQFGYSLSISSDGTKLAVGAWGDDSVVRNSGHVRVYELIQNNVEIINGNISGVNTITATSFIGDGSQLTGIANLTNHSDASFNNVDISGTLLASTANLDTLTVTGALGLGMTPDYGSSGSILTSNGSGSVPTWNEPYYFGADITANQSVPSDSQVKINFVPYLASPYNGNNGDMTAGTWTCPADGLYKVSLRAIVSTTGDDIRSADIYIISNDGSDTYESGAKYFNSFNDDIQVGTLACESLIPLSSGNTIRGEGIILISSGGGRQFEKSATAGGKGTELVITRII